MAQLKSTNILGNLAVTGNVVASSIKIPGESGFLKADGSVDDITYQPKNDVLTTIAALTGTSGFLKKTATDTWALDTSVVTGPTSATDNAIARFDATTGKIIQNSTATIDDDGNLRITGSLYVPEQQYAYFGTDQLATFRANAAGAFIIGSYDDMYLRGGLQSNSSASATGIRISKTYMKPEVTNTITLGASDAVWSDVYATKLTSTVATGTSPLTITSTTKVTNLNVDLLDGIDSTGFALKPVNSPTGEFVLTGPYKTGGTNALYYYASTYVNTDGQINAPTFRINEKATFSYDSTYDAIKLSFT